MNVRDFFSSKYFSFSAVILTIGGGALFLFWPMLSGKLLFTEEFIGLYYYRYFAAIKYFVFGLDVLPNWWPAYESGYPINLTTYGFLNPIFLLTLKFLSPFSANNLLIFLFFLANGAIFYAFARALKLTKIGSLIAAISYSFSGVILNHMAITGIASVILFLPLSFLCCLKIMQGKTKWFWPWLILLVYSWIGGWAEIIIYSLTATGFFVIYFAVRDKKYGNLNFSNLVLFFGAVILSVIILLPWFLSVLHFISLSARSDGINLESAGNFPTTLSQLIHMLNPRLSVFYGELLPFISLGSLNYFLYVGTLPLILILASLFINAKREKEYLVFFLSLAAGSILMTINHSPLFWIFHQIPVLKWFQGYWKWSFIIVFSLAVLAGFGFDYLKDFFANRFSKKIIFSLWALMIMAVLAAGLIAIFDQRIKNAVVDYGVSQYKNTSDRVFSRSDEYYRNRIEKMANSLVDNFSLKNKWTLLMIVLWFLALTHFTAGKYEFVSREKWKISAVLITLLGSVLPWTGLPNGPPISYLKTEPETAKYLHLINPYQSNKLPILPGSPLIPYRIFLYTPDQFVAVLLEKYNVDLTEKETRQAFTRELMDDDVNIMFNFDLFRSNQQLALRRLTELHYLVRRQTEFTKESYKDTTPFNQYIKSFSEDKNLHLLGNLNIKYILTPFKLENKLPPIFTSYIIDNKIPIFIYENPYFLPRWYFADKISWTEPENKTALETLQTIDNFKKITMLEKISLDDSLIKTDVDPKDKIELQLYTAGKLILKTKNKHYRFLVFSENKFPDFWRATINGNPAPIYTANYLYQAVLMPPGENIIEFRYPNLWEQGVIAGKLYFNRLPF